MTTLPVWASVAYAARCARRVQSLLENEFSRLSSECQKVDLAISTAEEYASDPVTLFRTSNRAAAASNPVDDAGQLAAEAADAAQRPVAAAAARAAQWAAKSAAYGCAYSTFAALYEETRATGSQQQISQELPVHSRRSLAAAKKCRETAAAASRSAYESSRLATPTRGWRRTRDDSVYVEAARRDYNRIVQAVESGEVHPLEPALPPEFFGPLWVHGDPNWSP